MTSSLSPDAMDAAERAYDNNGGSPPDWPAAQAAITAYLSATGWRTIDSAPKDGTGVNPMTQGVTAYPADFAQLMKFYDVKTVAELVAAQAAHIRRLQNKLPTRDDEFPGSRRHA